jgi:hypothetical protein
MTLDKALLLLDATADKMVTGLTEDGIPFSSDHDRGNAVFTIMLDEGSSMIAWVHCDWFSGCSLRLATSNALFEDYCIGVLTRGE